MTYSATVMFTCCGGAGGWSLLRSLAQADRYRLVGVDTDPLVSALYQPELAASYAVPSGYADDYVDRILELCASEGVDFFWPGADEEIIACTAEADRFAVAGIGLVASSHEVVFAATDKLAMVDRVAALGVPVPRSWRLSEPIDNPPTPVIVRPIRARSGHDVVFFDDADSLAAYAAALGNRAADQIVQEKLDYKLGRLYMAQAIYDREQNLKARFMSRSIRTTHAWGGPALGGVPVRSDRLEDLALRVMSQTGPYYGPVNTEFIYDETRQDFVFVEVNPRYWGYSYLATAAGLNFPDLTIRMMQGEDFPPQLDFELDIVTLPSREQLAVRRSRLYGELPSSGIA